MDKDREKTEWQIGDEERKGESGGDKSQGAKVQLQGHPSLQLTPPPRFSLENTNISYLGAGHPDLRPCIDVDTTVSLPGDGAAHSVGDAHSQCPAVLTVSQRQKCVCSLSYNTGMLSVSVCKCRC